MRLLAAELGEHGVKVNGINPDGVVRGSGIFAGGWGAKRAAVYGVPEEELGKYYASRTLLKREVLAGERCQRGLRALLGRPESHHWSAHSRRRRRSCRLPEVSDRVSTGSARRCALSRRASTSSARRCAGAIRRAQDGAVEGHAMTSGWVAAVDLGATSGRVMLGHLGPDQLSVEAVHRFPNDPVASPDGLHWNILELYRNLLIGLAQSRRCAAGSGRRRHRLLGGRLRIGER